MDYELFSKDSLTQTAVAFGAKTWNELTTLIKKIPYGRTSDRNNFGLVFTEQKGTCSSKHALLKTIADINNIPGINLVLGIYKMNRVNTPKIGRVLGENNIEYLPEAHCYLKINGSVNDLTGADFDYYKIKNDILEEHEIEPHQVIEYKVLYHRNYLKKWLLDNELHFTFDQLWAIREKCIQTLSK